MLVQDLQIGATTVASFRLDRRSASIDVLVSNTPGRAAVNALDAHHVPLCRAQPTSAEASTVGTAPTYDRRCDRSRSAAWADSVAHRFDLDPIEAGGLTGKIHLEGRCHIGMIGQGIGGNGTAEHGTHHAVASLTIGAKHPDPRGPGGASPVNPRCQCPPAT